MKTLSKVEMKSLFGGVATMNAYDYCQVNQGCGVMGTGTTVILNGLCACAQNHEFDWIPPSNVA